MCLPNFVEFKQISEDSPIIGYRNWRVPIREPKLLSEYMNYKWSMIEGPHEVLDKDSGIYSYNYYNNNYNNNYNHYNNNYNNYYNYSYNNHLFELYEIKNKYYNNNYCISGIIHQYGKVAIHESGYRSEYAKIVKGFTIRESDAKGPEKFLSWIKEFNQIISNLCNGNTIHYQDFIENPAKRVL